MKDAWKNQQRRIAGLVMGTASSEMKVTDREPMIDYLL